MDYVIALIGLIVFIGLIFLASSDKSKIKWKYVGIVLVIQLILAYVLLKTTAGIWFISQLSVGFGYLLKYAKDGIDFVFGGIQNESAPFVFFLNVLLPITVVSGIIGILQYLRIIPLAIKYLGWLVSRVNGLGKLESFNAAASVFFGQSEVFILTKKQIPHIPKHRLYNLGVAAMSTVSASIVGAYFQMIEPRYVVTAIALNLFGGFIVAHVINPYDVKPEEDVAVNIEQKQTFFEMLGEYILDGFKIAIVVAAMLIGYTALISMLNGIVGGITGGVNFQGVLGYIFAPLAFLTGVPWSESVQAGSIMATKLVTNEFLAMLDVQRIVSSGEHLLSAKAVGVVSVFLVSFANFASIGILAGTIKSISDKQGDAIATFGIKLLYGATMVSFISATIAGFFL